MKSLIYRYGSICEPDIIEGFKELGIEVLEINIEINDKSVLPAQIVKTVSNFLQDNPVDFVFSVNFYPALSEVCNIYHIRYFSWTVDSPVLEIFTKSITNEWNRTFLFDKAQFEEIYQYNPGKIFHLPLAANPESMRKRIESYKGNINDFAHDVAFVGSLYSEKCPYDSIKGLSDYSRGYLKGIINTQEKVYGYYFLDEVITDAVVSEIKSCIGEFTFLKDYENYLSDIIVTSQYYAASKVTVNERLHLFCNLSEVLDTHIYTASDTTMMPKIKNHGTCRTLTEMPVIFNSSKININTTSRAIRTGIPLRAFDILGCNGFMISNYQPELADMFVLGQEVIMYSSIDECVELCKYYLEHESERKEIARAGYEKLCKLHTYKIRLAQMITTGFDI